MADILPGFQFDSRVARFRDTARGQFVSRPRITDLMESQVNSAETRLGNLVQGVFDKSIAPGVAQEAMRDEMRRLTLQNNALGKGGLDALTFRDYGRAGRQLRDTYERITNLVTGIERGDVTLSQALRRIEGYTLEARNQFFAAQRDAQRDSGRVMEERRILHAQESCATCIDLSALSWRPQGELPLIGEGNTECGKYCRCSLESREVTTEDRAGMIVARGEPMGSLSQ